ncbi:metal ABC transporter ATP-binding protein [Paenibacillus sp. J2TS4]|uniref:metal ABC transporter ATP-binding protein n=1 Tax=Paenibacillus sp. J2TS4 TaxID=2807194 RepID=UPI001B19EC35|nr:metal ABC transporter ATP-binding protein [Paenibacillus sp. J2TS4]GIP33182.1 high-affinity zinc uptake system ATP-binding protein ZnuC [Paenibacillus sp. J2TS4]
MLLASMEQVTFGYTDSPCLEKADLRLYAGEFVAVTGPNGASKTTLLKLMLRLLKPWSGQVWLSELGIRGRKLSIGYVPQKIASFNSGFPSKVLELVRSGRFYGTLWLRRWTAEDEQQTETALRQVGMWELRDRKIGELSGGQKQRICIARALAQQPDLLVLDEPATGLDKEARSHLYQLLAAQVKDYGRTVVMVTHELTEVSEYLDRVIQLQREEHGRWKCCTSISCGGHFTPVD